MTALYHCGQPATSGCLFDLGLGWRHTIIDEPNFVSPWEASSCALELSFQLGTLMGLGTRQDTAKPIKRAGILRAHGLRPTFNDQIEVFIGLEDSLSMSSLSIAHDELHRPHAKPWGWYFACDTWDYDFNDDCYRSRKLNRCREPWASSMSISRPFGYITLRTTDAWHNPLPDAAPPDQHDGADDIDPDLDPAQAPRFIRDLLDLANRHHVFDDLDEPGSMRVRTWYLHHRDQQRNLHPRILEFDADWRRWEIDIGFAWRDFLHPNEEIQIHVIAPDPYRGYMTRPTHADLVISQGHWLPRYSSVITVHKSSRTHAPHSFAVASSLERRVSGVKLATETDVLHWCNHPGSRCTITHAWHEIPFTLHPTHEVFAGQSFVIQIVDANPTIMNSGSQRDISADEPQTTGAHDDEGDFDMSFTDQHDSRDDHDPAEPSPSGSSIHTFDLSLLIYRLEAPGAHGFSQGDNYAAILNAAIRACRLPRSTVRCFHQLAVCPVGVDADHETAIILQTVPDVLMLRPARQRSLFWLTQRFISILCVTDLLFQLPIVGRS